MWQPGTNRCLRMYAPGERTRLEALGSARGLPYYDDGACHVGFTSRDRSNKQFAVSLNIALIKLVPGTSLRGLGRNSSANDEDRDAVAAHLSSDTQVLPPVPNSQGPSK